jgi:hypothetical protein
VSAGSGVSRWSSGRWGKPSAGPTSPGTFHLGPGRARNPQLGYVSGSQGHTATPPVGGRDQRRQRPLPGHAPDPLNDQDLSYTRTGFDVRSAGALAGAPWQVGDPLSEAVCWNGFWLLVTSGELPAAQFTDMVCRRLQAGGLPEVGVETLLSPPSRPPRGPRRASERA